jgi:hypothetical protein
VFRANEACLVGVDGTKCLPVDSGTLLGLPVFGTALTLVRFKSDWEHTQERTVPYLFWAVLPFALMDTWWGVCEQRRDAE